MQGKIKWFNNKSNYGFIRREDRIEVFFHKSSLRTKVWPGKIVKFTLQETNKGPAAIEIID